MLIFLEAMPNTSDPDIPHSILMAGQSVRRPCRMAFIVRDLCITRPFTQFLRQARILILEILKVWMPVPTNSSIGVVNPARAGSPSLNLNEIGRFSKVHLRRGEA